MLVLTALFGCQTLPATGDPLSPVPNQMSKASTPVASTENDEGAPEPGGFDFDEDAKEIEGQVPDDPIALLAAQQGMEIPAVAPGEPSRPDADVPVAVPEPLAIPADYLPDASVDWGLRLVSTVHNVQPPRAIVGLPDGTEAIVTAGTILADQNAIVMAVGNQVIEVAYVTSAGYQAKIETRRITALFPE